KGDLLLRFDPTLKEIEVKRAEAGVALARAHLKELETGTRPEEILQAGADLRRGEAEHDLAKLQLERARRLAEEKAISAEELALAELRLHVAENEVTKRKAALDALKQGPRKERVEAAKAELITAEAQLDCARVLLDRTRIRAPIDGTILKRNAEPGNFIHSGAFP